MHQDRLPVNRNDQMNNDAYARQDADSTDVKHAVYEVVAVKREQTQATNVMSKR